ncbi:expressed unknown protein [Seminavis robusta]|uniref:Uncharacterized protein n=1 Tax=Seminavis robusta TaxID=568900 RepID=A0A9N8DFA0_9STRA|nr:expressed unknown protein [Seminavis robusta]|eukprot:Sro66_g037260.1 n/a (569) ;mRNA; r:99365-101170
MPEKAAPAKSRYATRMKEAVGAAKARNRSSDLVKLNDAYVAFTKKLKGLIIVLKDHHKNMMALSKTRLAVAKEVAKLAERSPLYDCTTELPSPERPADQVCSYVSIHSKVADKSKSYISKYAQFVVEYVIEWEKVVTARITVGLKKAEGLRVDLDHYQQKVETLRQSANQALAKGKMVDSKSADRLSRNEEKFMKSKQEYDLFATDLCILMEEVTERSWRDLHPLLIKLAQFDMTMSDDESKMMGQMSQVVKELKDVAKKNGLSPQPRLKEIEHQKPELLNTRGSGGDNRIEAGGARNESVNGDPFSSATPLAMPPGSVAPQGLGGFPVQVASSSDDVRARTTSYDSTHSGFSQPQRTMRPAPVSGGAPSTNDILKMSSSAAPPPTMDQVNASFNSSAGGLPPLGPSGGGSAYGGVGGGGGGSVYGGSAYGGSAYDDGLSVYSGASAPAPAAPPPPPPSAPPPPPPSMSMYSQPPPAPAQPSWNSYPQQPSYPPPNNNTNAFGAPPAPYGAPPQGNPNPFGPPPPTQQNFGQPSYGMPQQQYGQPPAPYGGGKPQRGTPLNSTNPFDD